MSNFYTSRSSTLSKIYDVSIFKPTHSIMIIQYTDVENVELKISNDLSITQLQASELVCQYNSVLTVFKYKHNLSHDVVSGSDITPCN